MIGLAVQACTALVAAVVVGSLDRVRPVHTARYSSGVTGDTGWGEIDARIDALVDDPVSRARLAERMRDDLLTTEEVGAMLGVSPQRVHQLAKGHPDFPPPTRQGARWSRSLMVEFLRGWARDPGRRAGA